MLRFPELRSSAPSLEEVAPALAAKAGGRRGRSRLLNSSSEATAYSWIGPRWASVAALPACRWAVRQQLFSRGAVVSRCIGLVTEKDEALTPIVSFRGHRYKGPPTSIWTDGGIGGEYLEGVFKPPLALRDPLSPVAVTAPQRTRQLSPLQAYPVAHGEKLTANGRTQAVDMNVQGVLRAAEAGVDGHPDHVGWNISTSPSVEPSPSRPSGMPIVRAIRLKHRAALDPA